MHVGIHPLQAKQRVGFEQFQPERARLDKAGTDPAGAGHGRQQQRVGPDQETAAQAKQRALAAGPLPVQPNQNRRRELGGCGKGNQAAGHQRIALADEAEIQIAEQNHHRDADATNAQQQARQVGAPGQPARVGTQQQRHDQIVADHGRQGHGLEQDHAGRRRQAA